MVGNMNTQNSQTRHSGSRLQQTTKPTIWSQQPTPQARDSAAAATENSWAAAMGGTRPNTQLDLSSSAFPSLNNSSQQSQNFNAGSAWQTGPPQSEQTRRQPMQALRPQASSRQQPTQSSDFFPSDTFSRVAQNDFSMPDLSSQPNRRTSTAPNGPPGLVARPGQLTDGVSGDPSRVTSPSGLPRDSRSPLSNLNGTIGQDRPMAEGMASDKRRTDFLQQSSPGSSVPRDPFAGREAFEPSDQTLESVLAGMSEKEKSGMKGYLALAEGPNPTLRSLMRGQDLAALGLNMNSDQPLMASYAGPFALPNAHPLRPLDNDFTTPDCYTVKKVAPLHTRINSFSDETLFYIFYSMPRDYMQVLVGQELMERKWRYHMREQMWMMRDENSQGYAYNDDRTSEQGYYIWWDKNQWKKIRRAYTLRYEDLDDLPSVGNRRVPQGMAGTANTGVNGSGAAGAGIFNAVPGLEKMAATGRGF